MKLREMLSRFQPYSWEPSNKEIAEKVGLKPEDILRFDTNTSPYKPIRALIDIAKRLPSLPINDYPDTSYVALRTVLAGYLHVKPTQVTVTAGADEALDIISKVFVDPGSIILTSTPTYSYYRIVVEALNGRIQGVPRRNDFTDDIDAIIKATQDDVRAIVLCSPNNPTGTILPSTQAEILLKTVDIPVIVDESYGEFSKTSLVTFIKRYPHLIVLRTFSKAFGLAGLRVGYMIAHDETIRQLNIMRPPNSVGIISLALAEAALRYIGSMKRNVKRIINERQRLARELSVLKGVIVYPSEANFLLVHFKKTHASTIYNELMKQGIIVRDVSSNLGLEDCLRFTVRTREEDNELLTAISRILGR